MSKRGPRSFDPVLIGGREAAAWAAYYPVNDPDAARQYMRAALPP